MSGPSADETRNAIEAYLLLHIDVLQEYNRLDTDMQLDEVSEAAQSAMAELVRLAAGKPEIVRELIQGSLSGIPTAHPQASGYRILVRVLGEVDESGNHLARLISAGGVHPVIQAASVHELGRRGDPTLLIPLIRHLRGGRWWRRRLNVIMDRVAGPDALDEVSTAIVQEMGRNHIAEALPALQSRQKGLEGYEHMGCWDRAELLRARGLLGDREALPALIDLGYTRGECAQLGREGLDALTEQMGGYREVIAALEGHPRDENTPAHLDRLARAGSSLPIRLWAQAALTRREPDTARLLLFERLGDPDWWVAERTSADLLALPQWPIHTLRTIAADPNQDRNRRLWAVYSLVKFGEEVNEIRRTISDGRAPLADSIPDAARRAALCSWSAGHPGLGTDVRWLIEAEIDRDAYRDGHRVAAPLQSERAQQETAATYREMLAAAGLAEATLTPYEQIEGYGMATFFVVAAGIYVFCINKCVPCCGPYDPSNFLPIGHAQEVNVPVALRIRLEEAGMCWLNSKTLDQTLRGLLVPDWSGDREATLGELVFSLLTY